MSQWLIIVFGALAVGSGLASLLSLYWDLLLKDRLRISSRLSSEFSPELPEGKKEALFRALIPSGAEYLGPWPQFKGVVEQAQVPLTAVQVLGLAAGAAMVTGTLATLLLNFPFGILVGLAVGSAPLLFVYWRRRVRLNRLLAQLPDALDVMARFLASGLSLSRAVQTIARDFDPPIATEFAACNEQMNLGLALEIALRDLTARIGLLEYKFLALAMMVHQQTGGNLVPLLEKLARVVRQRLQFAGRVRALTAEGRMQAAMLTALPPLLFGIMMLLNPSYAGELLDYPVLLAGVLLSMAVGALWIRRIIHIDG